MPPSTRVWNFPVNPPTGLSPEQADAAVRILRETLFTPDSGMFVERDDVLTFEPARPTNPPGPAIGRSIWDRLLDEEP